MLQTDAVSYSYTSQQRFQFPNLKVDEGEHLLILGNSGKGKTTYLHLLAGLLRPSSGTIVIGGVTINQLRAQELDAFRGKHIGIIFQQTHFVNALNVENNLLLAQYLANNPQDKQRVTHLLHRLGLKSKLTQKTKNLSVGERQRVAIARAMINHPEIILADEPTSNLDDENTQYVIELLLEQAEAVNANLIIVTHDQRLKDVFPNRIEL